MEEKVTIYLIEDNDSAVAQALRSFQRDKAAFQQAWLDWVREHLPSDALIREWSDGHVAGFTFPSGIPAGWKKPDKNGICWPRRNNPILKTMPLNKRFKRSEECLEEVGITVPTVIFEKNSNGETLASWGIWKGQKCANFYAYDTFEVVPHPDTARLDWLADPANKNGRVMLPAVYVGQHPDSMRDAIDAAMRIQATEAV